MDWPARSPDLNPIEHVWDFLGRRLAARTLPPLFNVCLDLGIFPGVWKLAQMILIPKVNEFRAPHLDNLRCISLLPALGKCSEKLFVNRICWYLRRGDFLSSDQYRFTPDKSTKDALLRLK
ncbi:uncharacterized protein TNCV_3574331 [Trichonephila clavipes]|nr:uncharacterized protein TNCV_3574331 [Trichonephila clavipes]